jgi:hypothetical protein
MQVGFNKRAPVELQKGIWRQRVGAAEDPLAFEPADVLQTIESGAADLAAVLRTSS